MRKWVQNGEAITIQNVGFRKWATFCHWENLSVWVLATVCVVCHAVCPCAMLYVLVPLPWNALSLFSHLAFVGNLARPTQTFLLPVFFCVFQRGRV